MRHSATLLSVVALTGVLSAQDYRVEVRLVEVEVRVTDRQGRPLPDLTRADFTLAEDGVPHDVATVQFVPPADPMPLRWERADGTPGVEAETIAPAASPTWIYLAAEVAPNEARRVEEAVRAFLLNGLRPGFKVSLGGRPFTDDRTALLTTLGHLSRNPLGSNGQPGLVDLARPLADDAAEERALAATFRRQEEGTAPPLGFVSRPERIESGGSFAQPMLTVGRAERSLPVYGDVALNQYFDLVERMAKLPGKKAIVLMRPGLRLEQDNVGLLLDLSSYAVRKRVSFYTVDSRGLQVHLPAEEKAVPFTIDRRPRRNEPDMIGELEMAGLARDGLLSLARETGGRALIGTNRLSDIFDRVAQDSSGYYVISYYPVDLRSAGRFRTIKVGVGRSDARVQMATKGYYETRSTSMFSKDDRAIALRLAMQREEVPVDLPVAASVSMFASHEGFPVLVLSAGVPAGQLQPDDAKTPELAATAILRVSDASHERLPLYFERKLDAAIEPDQWNQTRVDRTAFLAMSDLLPLLPGEYDWRIVFRDERTGKMGGIGGRVLLRDFRGPSTASSLLLTRQLARLDAGAAAAAGPERQPLEAGAVRFVPQPSMVFAKGETVHLLYSVYNATADDLAAVKQGMQLALLRDGRPISGVEAAGEPVVDTARGVIQFTGALRTASLEPGTYTVVGMLPNFETRSVKQVEQRFLLIEKASGS
jgi:VWFA-related protein